MNDSIKKNTMNGDKVAITRLMMQLTSKDRIIAEQQQKIADYERLIQSMIKGH